MKLLFITIFSLFSTVAAAQTPAYIDPEFDPCTRVQALVMLNKDNFPYWAAEPSHPEDILACYSIMKSFAQYASESEVQELQDAFEGRIRIFNTDNDFQDYLSQQGLQSPPQVTLPEKPESQNQGFKTINPYVQTEIINGLWVK